ncbi:putative ferric-chelate reductase 1 [Liparis tanakae]|uniref:Putative ferric-chelate reductase 1 n=1 Tax=Liparis tanakae TaxID=230148 RepID=A0A4Z2ENK6_9TELE|nr:putative ferric-chelate reductase 1 [Liparis tanakae]
MAPSHPPYTASTSSPPFTLSTSSATYRPGGVITVTVEVKNSSTEFQGFLLQARSRNGSGKRTFSGTWEGTSREGTSREGTSRGGTS